MDFIFQAIHWNINQEIFSIGSFGIRYYSLCWLLAFLVSYILMLKVFKRENKTQEELDQLTIYIFVGTLVGARLGHCLFYDFSYYMQNPLEMILPFQKINGSWQFTGFLGLASHGGAIGIITALYLYARKTKTDFLWLFDRLVLVIPVACAFIRIGNFFNSEILGKPADPSLSWAVIFEQVDLIPRHPAQLYEAIGYILLAILLWVLYYQKQNRKRGSLFGIFLVVIFAIRFFVEFYKENQEEFEDGMTFNMGQLLSIPFIAVGLYLIFRKPKDTAIKK